LKKSEIKEDLLKLPIRIDSKVNLWLVLADFKPATEVLVKETIFNKEERTESASEKDFNKVVSFIKNLGLNHRIRRQYNSGWRKIVVNGQTLKINVTFIRDVILVSKHEESVDQLYSCTTDLDRESESAHYQLGTLFGFPEKAVKEYAFWMRWYTTDKYFPKTLSRSIDTHKMLQDCYWEPYVQYIVRKGHEKEDSLVAKHWADRIRKDLPELAKKFEKEVGRARFVK